VLFEMEEAGGNGNLPLSLDGLGDALDNRGISADELDEAVEWLLEREEMIEVAEDMFGLGTG